jgi:hypothetical protein
MGSHSRQVFPRGSKKSLFLGKERRAFLIISAFQPLAEPSERLSSDSAITEALGKRFTFYQNHT